MSTTVYFSFGHGQTDPDTGEDLLDKYVTITGPDYSTCRQAMFASKYGERWSFDYIAGSPTADEWIPRWTEHDRIDLGSAEAVAPMSTEIENTQLIAGGCPDCICDPTTCHTDTQGNHCAETGCGACLHGCPTDEHDMTTWAAVTR